MNKEVVIVSAVRTPIGSFGGIFKDVSATSLGGYAIKAAVERANLDSADVDEVYMGCVLQANLGQAPARQASKKAGLSDKVICTTVNKVCASGMKSIALGAQSILLGDAEIVVAGGMENMSQVPFYLPNMRWGSKYGNAEALDGLAKDGLTDCYDNQAMGFAADHCANENVISREEQDAFATQSYKRSQKAWDEGRFADEVIEVELPQKKGDAVKVSTDEEPWNVKFDKISSLKPSFNKTGTVTAANASTLNDGAAAVVLMTAERASSLGLKPLAYIRSFADAEQEPLLFTTTPSIALPKAAKKAGMDVKDLDFIELNEAFSVVGIVNTRKMNLDPEKVNVNGGAVSLGHPLGCSGARIVVSLVHVLAKNGGKFGGAAICNGGGGASAMILERR